MRKKFYYGALALGLLFAGCSSDELIESAAPTVSDADQTFYVGMTIRGDVASGTRAADEDGNPVDSDDFAAGTEEESTVANCYFVFYDASGNVVGDIVPVDVSKDALVETAEGATVEKMYKSVVPVSVRKGENKPTQVICYINPISLSSLQNPLNMIQTRTSKDVYSEAGGKKLFAMSNSVYYDGENPVIAVPVSNECLKDSESAALAEDNEDIIDIYVERYAAKLQFSAAAPTEYKTATRVYTTTDNNYDTKSITLTFVPQRWALNAEANDTYVIKSFRQESQDGMILSDNYTYTALNQRINVDDPANYGKNELTALINGAWAWNNAAYHRAYWAVSPAYFTNEYPEVSGDVEAYALNQKYYSYAELTRTDDQMGFAPDDTEPHYFRETTVGTKAIASNNPAAAVASVIYVGQYKMEIDGEPQATTPNFYTYLSGPVDGVEGDRPYIYFENEDDKIDSKIAGTTSMLYRFLTQASILYKKEGTKYNRYDITKAADLAVLAGVLEVSEISDEVKAQVGAAGEPLKLQANTRSLQFTDIDAENEIYVATPEGYKLLVADGDVTTAATQISITDANAALMQQVGYAYYYYQGKGYFNIPVKHYGWYRASNPQKSEPRIDWNKVRVGDFGMVRNHSYNINVTKIEGLAAGISGDNVSIVPPTTTDEYYVAYTVRILKWAVVPQQDVAL